jgi:hypothetical protein
LGAAARALVEANRGAKSRTLQAIDGLLHPRRAGVVRPFRRVWFPQEGTGFDLETREFSTKTRPPPVENSASLAAAVVHCAGPTEAAGPAGHQRRQSGLRQPRQDTDGRPSGARLLVEAGERPAILSRGYAPDAGRRVVVTSDGVHLLADLDRSGDGAAAPGPRVPGAAVLVCEDRALAGVLAGSTTRRCTFWMTGFSICSSRAISIS